MALTDKLKAIADAIRTKTGSAEAMTLDAMPTAIEGIQTGSGADIVDAMIDGSLTTISSNVTKIMPYRFRGFTKLTTANFPAADIVLENAFENCTSLTTINLPVATLLQSNAFSGCTSLSAGVFTLVNDIRSYCFFLCIKLTMIDLPAVQSIGSVAFNSCRRLTAVILRGDKLCPLQYTNAFSDCYHFHGTVNSTYNPDGLKDGYFYVPSALVEEYKAATNWSTFASQFRALEDYTVDGTITGELDPTKI